MNHSEAEQEGTSTVMEVLKCSGEKGWNCGDRQEDRVQGKSHTEKQGPSLKAGEWPQLIFQ